MVNESNKVSQLRSMESALSQSSPTTQLQADAENLIPVIQNEPRQLQLLGAQKAAYWNAKHMVAFQMFCTILLPIILTVLGDRYQTFKTWGALIGLAILLLDSWTFELLPKKLRQLGAKIQEIFDCNVLRLNWHDFKVGSKPISEDIDKCIQKYEKVDPTYNHNIRNWYRPEVSAVPLSIARLICQRLNIGWDVKLRRTYGGLVLGLTILVLLVVIVYAQAAKWNVPETILTLANLAPLFGWGGREFLKQREAADNLSRLIERFSEVWEKVKRNEMASEEFNQTSRAFQDAIFDHRQNSPVIFDWVYNFSRDNVEELMKRLVKQMIEETSHLTQSANDK